MISIGTGNNEEKKDSDTMMTAPDGSLQKDFIRDIIDNDINQKKHQGRVATRFPPEPNGYLHIGHAKSICLNFGIAQDYKGTCNLRMDDTDPAGESTEYVGSIIDDVRWLGFDWEERLFYASDYFEQLYQFALHLIRTGKAYVCDLNADQIREYRGTLTEPGRESPYRSRTIEENLELFEGMRAGLFGDGSKVLRARIDMASPNVVMRDPVLYRIKREPHYRTASEWCIYPMYDFAHCLSDSIEKITHSICTLEFENNRPLYDWIVSQAGIDDPPQQIEFARLNITYTILSKRKLIELVQGKYVSGWDDPRMPTVAGMRRRGYRPEAVRDFCLRIGVAKNDSIVDISLLEHCVRENLNEKAPRAMGILKPLRLVIDNYPDGTTEWFEVPNHPQNPSMGSRKIPFSKVLYIEHDDFLENPPRKYKRLGPDREVRLRNAYVIKYMSHVKDASGNVTEVHCTFDRDTGSGQPSADRKVDGVIHWVSADHAVLAEVRLYDRLFDIPDPGSKGDDFVHSLNPRSLEVLPQCYVEASLGNGAKGSIYQFERTGYFTIDLRDSAPGKPVFNRVVSLRDSWAKIAKQGS